MFINITYKKPLEIIDQYLVVHRAFFEEGYKKDYFVASGPKNPRNGGIIISHLNNKEQLMDILQQDPFMVHDIAEYELIEFNAVKYHQNFAWFINGSEKGE